MGFVPDMGEEVTVLPFHPITGLQAIGFAGSKPVWPVMGGAPDPNDSDEPANNNPDDDKSDKGFPADTPIAEMTVEQQLAYFKHHDRKKADTLRAFKGLTPEQAEQQAAELEALRKSKLSADELAVEEARKQAESAAASEATGKWAPRLLKAVAGRFITDEKQLNSFLAITDAKAFIKDGEFDDEAVVGHLTGLFGEGRGTGQQQSRQWGQSGSRPPAKSAREQGLAEAKRRGHIKDD
jgi:hypothetical protein